MVRASDILPPPPRLSTGSVALDLALGGGWPVNQWSEVVGPESSGKTTIVLMTLAEQQRLDPEFLCVWGAAETFSKTYAASLGVDLSRVILIETNLMEVMYEGLISSLDSKEVDLVVLDSYPALTAEEEDTKAMDEFQMGLGARLTGKFFRKQGVGIRRSGISVERPVTGLFINQWREKIGIAYGDPRTTPGGRAKNYQFYVRVDINRDEFLFPGKDKKTPPIGQRIRMVTMKNKQAPPKVPAVVDFHFPGGGGECAGGYDLASDILGVAQFFDIIELSGRTYSYNGEKIAVGVDAAKNELRAQPDLYEAIRKEVLVSQEEMLARYSGTNLVPRPVKRTAAALTSGTPRRRRAIQKAR